MKTDTIKELIGTRAFALEEGAFSDKSNFESNFEVKYYLTKKATKKEAADLENSNIYGVCLEKYIRSTHCDTFEAWVSDEEEHAALIIRRLICNSVTPQGALYVIDYLCDITETASSVT